LPAARPTILQIIPQLDTGGAELSTIEIVEAISRAGGRALVATEGGRLSSRVTAAGGELIAFPAATKNPFRVLWNARALQRIIAARNVSLVHARSRAPAWSALLAARRARVPFVTTYHGAYAEQGSLKRLYNSVMARADVVIANSEFTAGLIRQRYRTDLARIRVIHRGVDCASFDPDAISPERLEALRRRWGIAASDRIVLQAARLTHWKGQSVLIEAAGILRSRAALPDDVAIILAGDAQGRDEYVDVLRHRIDVLGLNRSVHLVGHVDDIPAACAMAHVTVVPSIEPEAFGRAATEAQAMRSPVIATRLGAPPETVLAEPDARPDEITGWLVPPGDAGTLSIMLSRALTMTPGARKAIGDRARANVVEHFTLEAMKAATLQVYDELLGTNLAASFRPVEL
jgi:glycosyltransferase involved in cell wall biosynthesis